MANYGAELQIKHFRSSILQKTDLLPKLRCFETYWNSPQNFSDAKILAACRPHLAEVLTEAEIAEIAKIAVQNLPHNLPHTPTLVELLDGTVVDLTSRVESAAKRGDIVFIHSFGVTDVLSEHVEYFSKRWEVIDPAADPTRKHPLPTRYLRYDGDERAVAPIPESQGSSLCWERGKGTMLYHSVTSKGAIEDYRSFISLNGERGVVAFRPKDQDLHLYLEKVLSNKCGSAYSKTKAVQCWYRAGVSQSTQEEQEALTMGLLLAMAKYQQQTSNGSRFTGMALDNVYCEEICSTYMGNALLIAGLWRKSTMAGPTHPMVEAITNELVTIDQERGSDSIRKAAQRLMAKAAFRRFAEFETSPYFTQQNLNWALPAQMLQALIRNSSNPCGIESWR